MNSFLQIRRKDLFPKLTFFVLLFLVLNATPTYSQNQSTLRSERITFAAYRNGQWDIYSLAPDGSDPRQLTNDVFEDTDPAYSPDGTEIAFASRRERNWDVYVLDLRTGEETRLTTSPHYDGAPTWSPDGESLAYESYQAGNLDIWQVASPTEARQASEVPATNLTADSLAGDFAPAWSPEGDVIAFSSWREGDKDLFLLNLETGRVNRLTETPVAELGMAWHPDGDQLAVTINNSGDREIFWLEVEGQGQKKSRQITWLGRTAGAVWSPNGEAIAAVFHRWDGEIIAVQEIDTAHQLLRLLTEPITLQGRLTWHKRALDFGRPVASLKDTRPSPLYEEEVSPNDDPGTEPYNLVRLNDIKTGTPWLADTVDDSFRAWRFRLRDEVGYDFLSELSDASRDLAQFSDTTQYASWHKSGRAVDTLFDYFLGATLAHEIVKENYSGNTYWRVLLRCADQSGRCGRPVVDNMWNYSENARTKIAPEQGGVEKTGLYLSGYYVDFTALAREYGWERISSYDDQDYSWTWHFLAFEYWHYQKRFADPTARFNSASQATNWYEAMRDVYPVETLEPYFNWRRMRQLGDKPHLIALKGVPLPLEVKPWWALVKQP
jgi:TolB protein